MSLLSLEIKLLLSIDVEPEVLFEFIGDDEVAVDDGEVEYDDDDELWSINKQQINQSVA